jgi:hypothetical protein
MTDQEMRQSIRQTLRTYYPLVRVGADVKRPTRR